MQWQFSSLEFLASLIGDKSNCSLDHQKFVSLVELHQEYLQLYQLIESLPGIVFITPYVNQWSMDFLSQGCFPVTGYHPQELIGNKNLTYEHLIHPRERLTLQKTIKKAITEKQTYNIEYRIRTKNGEEKWIWEQGQGIWDELGQVRGRGGYIYDITPLKAREQALRESEAHYRLLADNTTDIIAHYNIKGICLYISSVCQSLLGYPPQKFIGQGLACGCHPDDVPIIEQFYQQICHQLIIDPVSYRLQHQNGKYIWFETTAKTILNPNTGELEAIITTSREITKWKLIEEALCQAEDSYHTIFEYISQGIFQTSIDGHYLQANPALAEIFGYDSVADLLNNVRDIENQIYVKPERRSQFILLLQQQGWVSNFESEVYHRDGSTFWISENARAIYDSQGQFLYYEGTVENITYRRLTEARLIYDAYHDPLTKLPNRAWFMNQLQTAIFEQISRSDFMYAVLFIDLDGFKVVNDSLGHLIGDEMLKQVCQRLKNSLRPHDKVARFGGDEFVILLENIHNPQEAIQVAERIKNCFKKPFLFHGETIFTSASIGITLSSVGYELPEHILRDADVAMYKAKAKGKDCYAMFESQLQIAVLVRLQLESDLRKAVKKQQFQLYYQPIVGLSDGHLSGFEALIRWPHPEKGFVSPVEFIPIAEETGLIQSIGWWVLQEACRQLQVWKKRYPQASSLVMNVNLSGHQLKEISLIERIEQILQETNIEGSYLKLEITESCFLKAIAEEADMIQQLKELGVRLCIDDFGTGYSSLSRLHEFPIDTLKIDRSFIKRLEKNQTAIVQTIISLAHTLDMNVVAEGIETIAQLEKLNSLGCELGQGYFFSKPIDNKNASQFIRFSFDIKSA
jgi:diguanylate cyclase (GGDEF)-like protein/PAS domain S-box-containing protein